MGLLERFAENDPEGAAEYVKRQAEPEVKKSKKKKKLPSYGDPNYRKKLRAAFQSLNNPTPTTRWIYNGYYHIGLQLEHRLVYFRYYGAIPDGYEVHHIDCNPLNNDITNLIAVPEVVHRHIHAYMNRENVRLDRGQTEQLIEEYRKNNPAAFVVVKKIPENTTTVEGVLDLAFKLSPQDYQRFRAEIRKNRTKPGQRSWKRPRKVTYSSKNS